ncbi:MAG TPA: isocitrate lyase/phosphoenolpyruvate mutase family protein, partial [Nocardioides sp.]|nr:isocitrate lyase/phosphoenolpyruvate mutase family protein [Nocardioides sp.]
MRILDADARPLTFLALRNHPDYRGAVTRPPSAADFLAMHHGPGFVLPNAWDPGSARILEQLGFPALATTSAGIAWACGVPDGGDLDLDTMLDHVRRIVAAVGVPVTADLEAGYDDVARTVRRAVEAGAVGGNLEDQVGGVLFGIDEAAERI